MLLTESLFLHVLVMIYCTLTHQGKKIYRYIFPRWSPPPYWTIPGKMDDTSNQLDYHKHYQSYQPYQIRVYVIKGRHHVCFKFQTSLSDHSKTCRLREYLLAVS